MFERVRNLRIIAVASIVLLTAFAIAGAHPGVANDDAQRSAKTERPLNIAVLIQDDLVSHVSNEIGVTANFIRTLPPGSRVMVGYITSGSLQVRQQFTTDLNAAAGKLRIPASSTAVSPYNPYVEVIEAVRQFKAGDHNVVLLISDGLDTSHGFDSDSAGHTIDIDRAIHEANARNVSVYSFYAPTVGLTSHSLLAASYGQSSLNRISIETGGQAYFQGLRDFVTFDSYFERLRQALTEQYARAS